MIKSIAHSSRVSFLIFCIAFFLLGDFSFAEKISDERILSVGITSPTNTDQYKFGEAINISWQNADLGSNDRFSISYSVDDGPFNFIANPFYSQLTNSGDNSSYSWLAPDLSAALDNNVRIKVENTTQQLSDTSDVFRIYFEPSLDIVTPISTEQYKFGETILFSWKNQDLGTNDRFSISYRVDGGVFNFIANPFHSQLTNVGDTSKYSWILPDLGTNLESQIDIRIQNALRAVEDTSEAFRAYFEPSLEILNPISTEEYKFGETINFSWINQDLGTNDRFAISYRVDDGNFTFIANPFHSQLTNSGDTSNYSWILPDLGTNLESQIDIRIQNTSRAVEDTSQAFRAYFEPNLEILNPISTEQYKFGETIRFSWKNQDLGTNDRFSISYRVDGGNFAFIANPFHSQLTNSGDTSNYSWILPDLGTDLESQIDIRIRNTSRAVEDTSQAFRAYFEPFVILDLPDSTDQFKFGEAITISWLNNDLGVNDRYSLSYSIDGGNYSFIANPFHSQLTNDDKRSSYSWIVPDLGTALDNQVNIRVLNSSRDVADTTSTFRVYFDSDVVISTPAKDQYVLQGGTTQVTWENGDLGTNDRFSLRYSIDGGIYNFVANPFHSQLVNDGNTSTYNWNVPIVESTNVRFIVGNTTRTKFDTTEVFTICLTCPAINLSSPNGGEQFRVGTTYPISWSTGETWLSTDSIVVDYSLDAGVNYETTTVFQGNYAAVTANSTAWTVPENVSSTVRVRVRNVTQSISDESDANFSILPALVPSLSLVKPNGGEVLTGGQLFNIQWSSQNINSSDSLYIELSNDNGTTYSTVEKGLFSTYPSRYTWKVPENASTSALIRIRNITTPINDMSDNSFTIVAPVATLSLIQPNGGEMLTVGETFNITWSTQFLDNSDDVTIEFSSDAGATYGNIATGTVESFNGRYIWAVPNTVTTQGSIRISSVSSAITVASETNFSISLPPDPLVNLINPDGGEVLEAGDNYTISWSVENTPTTDELSIAHSVDGGTNYTEIVSGTVGSFGGSYVWSVPFSLGNNSKIRITNTTASVFDESSIAFTIESTPIITVLTPNGGEAIQVGSTYEISWTMENISMDETLIIELSTNAGASYTEVDRGTFGTTYSWTVPDLPSTSGMIRVANEDRTASDRSNNFFNIIAVTSVAVTSPNGGEFWEVGSQQRITWSAVSFATNDVIQIQLSTDNGATYNIISEGFSNIYNGSLFYRLVEAASTECLVKVVNSTQEIEDVSDATFEIGTVNRTLTVESPNGGEQWLVGTSETISWSRTNIDNTDQIKFEISTDGGENFSQIGAVTTFGDYANNIAGYSIPNTISDNVIIQITNVTRDLSDQSDAPFSIVNEIAPNWLSFEGEIVGGELTIDYQLNEASNVFLVAIPNGNEVPTREAIKIAAQGGDAIPNQAVIGTASFGTLGSISTESYTGTFVSEARYDIHAIAEDIDGNFSEINTVQSVLAQFTLAEQDSIILNSIYDQYNGVTWRNTADDWKSLTIADRTEVTVNNNGRVTALNLSDKGIVGGLSESFLQLGAIVSLDLSENGLTGLISLNSLTSLTALNVADNALDFGDLLLAQSLLTNGNNYAPQASIQTTASDTIPTGSSVQLQAFTQGSGNVYTWRLSNILVKDQVVTAATQASFIINQLVFENMGTYRVSITNPAFPALTLEGNDIVIAASANLSGTIQGINNLPLSSGNVRLLQIIEVDTGYFNARIVPVSNGVFTANNLVLGRYLAITDSELQDAENKKIYLPTYYKDSDLWAEADTILLFADQDVQDYSMQFFPPPLDPNGGEGVVAGTVESDFSNGRLLERRKVKKAGCSVRRFKARGRDISVQDGTWELLAYVETNDNGEFEFEFLPPGLYRFNIEFPGIPMDPDSFVEFEIGGNGFDATNFRLEAFITADGIEVTRVGLLSIYDQGFRSLNIYPNPANDYLTIAYDRLLSKDYVVNLFDLEGKQLLEQKIADGFDQKLEIPVSHLENGLYLLTFNLKGSKNAILSMKVLVRH